MKTNLAAALAYIDEDEGPELNITPKEPGGSSKHGVSMETLQMWHRSKGLPLPTMADMRAVDAKLAGEVYTQLYAMPIRFDDLPGGVDYRLLDISVSVGISGSLVVLGDALGRDAHYDDATIAFMGTFDPLELATSLGIKWLAYKKLHGDWSVNGKGWTNRNNRMLARVSAMIASPSTATEKETPTMSAPWRVAKSLVTLLSQVNAYAPHRRKDSDGTIGDARHQAEKTSDHNPYIVVAGIGVVRAEDFTHAPETGFDAYAFAEMLLKNKDSRIRYVISNKKIASGKGGPDPWVWRPYHGTNPHDHHTHVSVTENASEFDNPSSWNLAGLDHEAEVQAPAANNYVVPPATLRIKARGDLVKKMQAGIGITGAAIDGFFGAQTQTKLMAFQKAHNLTADGVCGPATWKVIAP